MRRLVRPGGRRVLAVGFSVLMVMWLAATGVGFVGSAAAQTQHQLGGDETDQSLRITVTDGDVGIERYDADAGSWIELHYSEDSSETVLNVGGTLYDIPGGGIVDADNDNLVVADQYTTNGGDTVVTEFDVPDSPLEFTQRITYSGGSQYSMAWSVTNTGAEPVNDVRLLNGRDSFSGVDSSNGFWEPSRNAVGAENTLRLEMVGVTDPDAYQSDEWNQIEDSLDAGALTNNVIEPEHDSGFALEWQRDSIAAGDTWTVEAVEGLGEASVPESDGSDDRARPRFDVIEPSVSVSPDSVTTEGDGSAAASQRDARNPDTFYTDDTIVVTAEVTNEGGASGTFHAWVSSHREVHYDERVEIDPGETRTFTVPVEFEEPGHYWLEFSGRVVEQFEVEERPPAPLDEEDLEVQAADTNRSAVAPGEVYTVSTTVENTDNETGMATVEFATEGDDGNATVVATRQVPLEPGEAVEVSHEAVADAGDGEVTWLANGEAVGSVEVLPAEESSTGVVEAYIEETADGRELVAHLYNGGEDAQAVAVHVAGGPDRLGTVELVMVGPGETVTVRQPAGDTADLWVNGEQVEA